VTEPSYSDLLKQIEKLLEIVASQAAKITELEATVAQQSKRIVELERQLGADSSNSSRPPSSDAPWGKKPAKKRSSRQSTGRKPGKQPGDPGVSRSLSDNPDVTVVLQPPTCRGCRQSLTDTAGAVRDRRQVVDLPPVAAPVITEYQLQSKRCPCCDTVTVADWTDNRDANTDILAAPGSPVRIGSAALAMCVLLTCGQHLPVGRATALLETLTGLHLSTGFTGRARRRAYRKLLAGFAPHMKTLLATAPILHADETTGRANQALAYVHIACTQYLTMMHVGGRTKEDIDEGGILPDFTGILVRDGYAGYDHLPAVHAWCAAHLLRDLRSVSDTDPHGQLWAVAMADTLTGAHRAAQAARAAGAHRLDPATVAMLLNHYLGALAKGTTDNRGHHNELSQRARTLIGRFRRFQDMILRFATDLAVPFTNNEAERSIRPVKVQQKTSGGCWRTLAGLTEFALVHSYLNTAHKWGIDKLQVLQQLFTTGPWLPPALTPAE